MVDLNLQILTRTRCEQLYLNEKFQDLFMRSEQKFEYIARRQRRNLDAIIWYYLQDLEKAQELVWLVGLIASTVCFESNHTSTRKWSGAKKSLSKFKADPVKVTGSTMIR